MSIARKAAFAASFFIFFGVELAPDTPFGLRLAQKAYAVVGAPMTPGSVAGVARRTTRRTVAVVAAADSSHESAQAATAQQQAATAQQQAATAAPAGQALPLGTVVTALPSGCAPMASGGVEYQKCGPNYYRTAFQGSNLVYVTAQP